MACAPPRNCGLPLVDPGGPQPARHRLKPTPCGRLAALRCSLTTRPLRVEESPARGTPLLPRPPARPTRVEADAVRTAGSAPLLFDNSTASRGGITRQRPAVAQRPPGTLPPPQLKPRSEEHTSELQSLRHLVCRLLLEKKDTQNETTSPPDACHPTPAHSRTSYDS